MAIDTRKYIQDPNNPAASIPNPSYGAVLDGQYKSPAPITPTTPDAPITPTPGSGTYPEDLANNIQKNIDATKISVTDLQAQQAALKQYNLTDTKQLTKDASGKYIPSNQSVPPPVVGTSDAERAAKRAEEIEKIKSELGGGAIAPNPYKSVEDYDKLRKEQGIVKDEEELASLQNESALINEELRKFKSTAGEGVSEAGRVGMVSEAERNANFRLEGLSIRENAVVNRLNSKNAYIGNMLKLGFQDYQTAYQEYTDNWNQNLQIQNIVSKNEDQDKQDAIATLNTMTQGFQNAGITWSEMTPSIQAQIKANELKLGMEGFTQLILSQADKPILTTIVSDDKSSATILYKDGTSKTIDTGMAPGGGLGLTPAQVNQTINSIAGAFDNEPIVKNFNIVAEGKAFVDSLSNLTTNPADDQGLIYSLAKALDPNSVVREGEYATVQKYSQSFVKAYGKTVTQALAGTGFLSEEARRNIKSTITSRYNASLQNYQNVYDSYQKQIEDVKSGKVRGITDYSQAYNFGQTNQFSSILDALYQQSGGEETPKVLSDPTWTERHPVLTRLYNWIFK